MIKSTEKNNPLSWVALSMLLAAAILWAIILRFGGEHATGTGCADEISLCKTSSDFKANSSVFNYAVQACKEKTRSRSTRQASSRYHDTTGDVVFGDEAFHTLVMFEEAGGGAATIITMKDEDLKLKDTNGRWLEARSVCGFNIPNMEAELIAVGVD